MVATSSKLSPWIVVHADDKKAARLNIIRDLISRLACPGIDKHLAILIEASRFPTNESTPAAACLHDRSCSLIHGFWCKLVHPVQLVEVISLNLGSLAEWNHVRFQPHLLERFVRKFTESRQLCKKLTFQAQVDGSNRPDSSASVRKCSSCRMSRSLLSIG
ncbi:MAG: hypothetical protein J0G37_06595 [Afipia sp.]|nr:hypothetical protein [Afipia sp.]